jgi:hypothetical protein
VTTSPAARPTSPRGLRRPPHPEPSACDVAPFTTGRDRLDPVPVAAVQGSLALDLLRSVPAPAEPRLRAVPEPDGCTEEVRAWAARFARAVVEVIGGDRPLPQLLRWTSPRVYAELGRRVRILAQARPVGQQTRTIVPQVLSVHVSQPVATGAEISVHVRYGQRSRAIAARLERRDDRWTCTDLRIG